MKLYRFSPIKSEDELIQAITYTHKECFELCHNSFGGYLPVAGNIGIFCHYDEEYEFLTGLRKQLTESSDNVDQKYFRLHVPIVIAAQEDIPETTYTHLYIRKPDIYRAQVGDVDFVMEAGRYEKEKEKLANGESIQGARIFPRSDLDMIELYNPDIDVLGYVSVASMTEKVRVKTNFG